MLGPRLQRELKAQDPAAPATRRRLVVVGWFNFALTLAVPILGAVVLDATSTELTIDERAPPATSRS